MRCERLLHVRTDYGGFNMRCYLLSIACALALVLSVGPAVAQQSSPAPASGAARGAFNVTPNTGPEHHAIFYVRGAGAGATNGIVVFGVMLHVLRWPAGATHELTYHLIINDTPQAKKTVTVPDSNDVPIEYVITGIASDVRFNAQVVSDEPFVQNSRKFSAVETCSGRGTGGCHIADQKAE